MSTIGGTGKQGQDKEGGKPGMDQEISSPWDICKLSEKCVAIAMAGIHQVENVSENIIYSFNHPLPSIRGMYLYLGSFSGRGGIYF